MPGPHEGNVISIFERTENIDSETGNVESVTYARTAHRIPARLTPISAQEKFQSGIAPAVEAKRLHIRADRLASLTANAVIVDETEGSDAADVEYWGIYSGVERYRAGPGSWQANLLKQDTPHEDITTSYS